MKKIFVLLLITIASSTFAQKTTPKFDWFANFHNIMDNREYKRSVGTPQSIMGARADLGVGLQTDTTSGFYVGLNYMYEYGGKLDSIPLALNLFYEINREDFAFYVGEFNREKIINFPLFMISDSLCYYTPNIGGTAFEIRRGWGYQNAFLDWTGRRSKDTRESFMLGISGKLQKGLFYFEDYFYMYHYALRSGYDPNEHIRDNGIASIFAGVDLSSKTPFNIFKVDIGGIANYDRTRPADYAFYGGAMARLNLYYKRFGTDITSYWGQALQVPLGDPLYKNGNYTRWDLCAIPIVGKIIESKFKWSFHFTGGEVSTSQQLFFTARF